MTANTPSHLVPKLRFPKFEGAGDWEEKRLSSLVKLVSGVHLAPDMYSTTGEVPYFTGPSDFTDAIQCVAKWTTEPVNIAKQHDTVITVKGSGVGQIWYLTLPSIAMGRQLMAVRTEIGDRRFIYQFLSTRRAQFEALASGNLIPGLSRGDILGMAAYFPSRDEQQKIADCLGSLDDLIAADGRKLEALRQHKQGLMQQLFPQPGETVPRLRFPEFQHAGGWKEKQLGKMLKIGNGRDHKYLSEGEHPVYGTGGYMRSVNDYLHDGESVSIGRKGTIDKPMFLEGKFWTVDTLFFTHSFKDCLPKFVYLIFQNIPWQEYNAASGVPSLSKTTIEKIEVFFPKVPEQQKVADCLGSLDDLIAAEGRKLEALRQHKQGLMQQLFPSLDGQ